MMNVSRSGYYAWYNRKPSKKQKENKILLPIVIKAAIKSKFTYGTRRIAKEIQSYGFVCGRTRARSLMKLVNVEAKQKRKFRKTTDSNHNMRFAPNLLQRKFDVDKPDKVYVSDITYIWTQRGWLYLAVVIDLYSRQIVGWAFNKRLVKEIVIEAVRMAVWKRKPDKGLILHSDRGSQYCSEEFQKLLKLFNIRSSMSRKGNCWDNAVAESFFGSLKTERVYFTNYKDRKQAKQDIIDYVDYVEMYYNSNRRHSYLGYISPRDFERKKLKEAA